MAKKEKGNQEIIDWLDDKVGCLNIREVADFLAEGDGEKRDAIIEELMTLVVRHRANKPVVSVDTLKNHYA